MRATARESQVGPQRSRVPCRNRDQPMSYQQEGTSNEKRDQACGDMKESFSVSDSKPLGDQPRSHDPARVATIATGTATATSRARAVRLGSER
jgi:hypothetical protein